MVGPTVLLATSTTNRLLPLSIVPTRSLEPSRVSTLSLGSFRSVTVATMALVAASNTLRLSLT